ncbi:MAG: alpha/beta fold hydrolase [Verrucomicrobiota bacterium]
MKHVLTAILAAALFGALPACQGLKLPVASRPETPQAAPSLSEARQAWRILQRESPSSEEARGALLIYNQAVASVVKSLRKAEGTAAWGKGLQLGGSRPGSVTVDARGTVGTFALQDFEKCEPSSDVILTGFDKVVAHDGLGVPVVLGQDDSKRVAQPFHPPGGEFLPATAVLEFPPSGARLRFYNPLAVSRINVGPNSQRLSQNLTAPLQRSLTNTVVDERNPQHPAPSASGEVESQLFFLNRYDKTKVPVVFVHGLLCGPDVWKNSVNELLADPDLRRRYQPVCFMYPTKLPIPVTAARLRELIKRSREKLDPARQNPGYSEIVLVGHSMGGLVSRMQVIDSGDDFWRAFFVAPPRKVSRRIDAKTRRMVNGALFFKRQSDVKRVIFISTPHLGSDLADVGMFQAALRLFMIVPKTARQSVQALVDLPADFVQPILRDFPGQGVEGTENLSTKHPFFGALAERRPAVPFHSIIATRGKLDFRNGGDGVVPYTSAHLDGAASETTVPYTHGCLEKPDTVQAVMKILKNAR